MTTRREKDFKPGDLVAITLPVYKVKTKEFSGSRVAVKGKITRVWRVSQKGHWRADVEWENKVLGFMYTGKDGWAYFSELTMVKRYTEKMPPTRRYHGN